MAGTKGSDPKGQDDSRWDGLQADVRRLGIGGGIDLSAKRQHGLHIERAEGLKTVRFKHPFLKRGPSDPVRKGAVIVDGLWRCRKCGNEVLDFEDGTNWKGLCDRPFASDLLTHALILCSQGIGALVESPEKVRAFRRAVLPDMAGHPAIPPYLRRWALRRIKRGRRLGLVYRVLRETIRWANDDPGGAEADRIMYERPITAKGRKGSVS